MDSDSVLYIGDRLMHLYDILRDIPSYSTFEDSSFISNVPHQSMRKYKTGPNLLFFVA